MYSMYSRLLMFTQCMLVVKLASQSGRLRSRSLCAIPWIFNVRIAARPVLLVAHALQTAWCGVTCGQWSLPNKVYCCATCSRAQMLAFFFLALHYFRTYTNNASTRSKAAVRFDEAVCTILIRSIHGNGTQIMNVTAALFRVSCIAFTNSNSIRIN